MGKIIWNPALYPEKYNEDFHRDRVIQFIVGQVREQGSMILPPHIKLDNIQTDIDFRYDLNAFVVHFLKNVYKTTDSNRFETKTNSVTTSTEVIDEMIPATIWDHIKHKFVSLFTFKIHWIHVEYLPLKKTIVNTTNTTNHNTILEFVCPHLDLPSNNQQHVLHLAQGISREK